MIVNSLDVWSFLLICIVVGFVLYVSVVMVSCEEKDRIENRRVVKVWGDEWYEIYYCLVSLYIDKNFEIFDIFMMIIYK